MIAMYMIANYMKKGKNKLINWDKMKQLRKLVKLVT